MPTAAAVVWRNLMESAEFLKSHSELDLAAVGPEFGRVIGFTNESFVEEPAHACWLVETGRGH